MPEVDIQSGGALPEPVQMLIQKRGATGMNTQSLPDAVAQNESTIENRNGGLGPRDEFAIKRNENIRIAGVIDVIVRAMGHDCRVEPTKSRYARPPEDLITDQTA